MMKKAFIIATIFLSQSIFAQLPTVCRQVDTPEPIEEMSSEDIDKWLQELHKESVKESGGLTIAGEVTTKWKDVFEKIGGVPQVGLDSVSGKPNNQFTLDVVLLFSYKAERTWANIKLEFDNRMGRETGTTNAIALQRANLGYHILTQDSPVLLDILVGRIQLSDLYYSEIEFDSIGDGATLTLKSDPEGVMSFIGRGGIYLEDANTSHPFWIVDVGSYDIAKTGVYLDLSLIDWAKDNVSAGRDNPEFKFIVGQLSTGWTSNPKISPYPIKVFGACLWNFIAPKTYVTDYERAGFAWNLGVQVGKVQKQYDWAFKMQWQSVQAQAVPNFDVSGIGTGNAVKGALYSDESSPLGNGNTNYQGFEISGIFGLTKHIVIKPKFQRSVSLNNAIGSYFSYTRVGVDASYIF